MYQMYQAQADATEQLRLWAERDERAAAQPVCRSLRAVRLGVRDGRLRDAGPRRLQPRAQTRSGSTRFASAKTTFRCAKRSPTRTPFATLLHFKKDVDDAVAARAARGPDVGSLCNAAARDGAHDAAGPRRLPDRLAQRARRQRRRRPLRHRRVRRARDPVPRSDRPRRARRRGLSAVRRRCWQRSRSWRRPAIRRSRAA